jgi:hypothetical protein
MSFALPVKLSTLHSREWIGVDLDGTLAEYHGFTSPTQIGKPIAAMVERVRRWLREGKTVKIFTARANQKSSIKAVKAWCREHLGEALPVTNVKDRWMMKLWDDRCEPVERNTGKRLLASD